MSLAVSTVLLMTISVSLAGTLYAAGTAACSGAFTSEVLRM